MQSSFKKINKLQRNALSLLQDKFMYEFTETAYRPPHQLQTGS